MSFNIYDASIPVFVRCLSNMATHLDKAEAFAASKKFDANNLLSARLAPDMLPFIKQIQIACDAAKFCAARLAGVDAPSFDDSEKTLAELRGRIAATVNYVKSVPREKLIGAEERPVTFKQRGEPVTLIGAAYLTEYALPNFFFHYTMTYALLRHNGVDLGKSDYLRGAN